MQEALGQAAYRIVQEAMTNVIRHANAAQAEVILDHSPDALIITVAMTGKVRRSSAPATASEVCRREPRSGAARSR